MQIIVLLKQVPNTTKVKLDPKTGSLIREGIEAIINPEDRHALEEAVRLKAQLAPDGSLEGGEQPPRVVALTMGPPQAIDALTEALACGADQAVLLTDRLFAGADTWATSTVLARAIEKLGGAELVLAGRQAIDGDTAQVGPQVAEALGMVQATYVERIDGVELIDGEERIDGEEDGEGEGGPERWLTVTRKLDGGRREQLRLRPPALLTVLAELNRPRYPVLGSLLAACERTAPIRVLDAADLGFKADEVGLAGSLTEVVKTFSPKGGREAEMLEGTPAEMVTALLERLGAAKVLAGVRGAGGVVRGATGGEGGGR